MVLKTSYFYIHTFLNSYILGNYIIKLSLFFCICQKLGNFPMSKDFHKMNDLRKVLASNPKINNLLSLVRNVLEKYKTYPQQDFVNSMELKFLSKEMEKIHINQIQDLLDGIDNPETIIALPLSIQKYFTLFFVIVPHEQQFNWHDHPKMTGFTKCVHGKLKITAMDKQYLKQNGDLYYFPTQNLRVEILQSKTDKNLSAIYPDQFNVHKIQALSVSAFFDLLMPDYPDDICSFLNTVQQKDGYLVLQKLENSIEQIKGFDVVLKELSQVKKVENIILK